jgi:hypothetical protein
MRAHKNEHGVTFLLKANDLREIADQMDEWAEQDQKLGGRVIEIFDDTGDIRKPFFLGFAVDRNTGEYVLAVGRAPLYGAAAA